MITLQKQIEKDFPNKNSRKIVLWGKHEHTNFTNYDLDLSEYVNLDWLNLNGSKLTSADFLNTISNPEKLETLLIQIEIKK